MKNHQTLKGYFITGSDTAAGKTWISCQLIHQFKQTISSLKVRKPVESGCDLSITNELQPADGLALFNANDKRENLQLVTAFRFQAAVSPDRAARLEKQTISLSQLDKAVRNNLENNDFIIVEGAGGFYSPIAEDGLNADLAKLLGLEIIIVIADRLGAINQALLTIKAVEVEGLPIKAIILNRLNEPQTDNLNNLEDLKKRISYPIYYCPYNGKLEDVEFSPKETE